MILAYRNWSTINQPPAWARRVASRALARHIAGIEENPVDDVGEHGSLLPPLTNVAAWEQQHEVLRVLDLLPLRQRQVMARTLDGTLDLALGDHARDLASALDALAAELGRADRARFGGGGTRDLRRSRRHRARADHRVRDQP